MNPPVLLNLSNKSFGVLAKPVVKSIVCPIAYPGVVS